MVDENCPKNDWVMHFLGFLEKVFSKGVVSKVTNQELLHVLVLIHLNQTMVNFQLFEELHEVSI